MREILFRGKRLYYGEWAYGDLWHNNSETMIIDQLATIEYDVIPETVGQYTGLCDKNGKKIFEGDIIRLTPPKESREIYVPSPRNPQEDRILKVVFFDGMFAVDMSKWIKYGHGKIALENYETNRIEIIGNIHDDPEK